MGSQGKPACAQEIGQQEPGGHALVHVHDAPGYEQRSSFTPQAPSTGSLTGHAHAGDDADPSHPPSPASPGPLDPELLAERLAEPASEERLPAGALDEPAPPLDRLPCEPGVELRPRVPPASPAVRLDSSPAACVARSSEDRAPQPPT